MVKHRERPGPFEFLAWESRAELHNGATPDGTMPGLDPLCHPLRRSGDLKPLALIERQDAPQSGGENARRTSLERDNLRPVGGANRSAEERVDSSTHDGQRENALDPVQDDSGPQSDQA